MSDPSTADTGGFDPGRLRTAPTQMMRSRDDRYIAGVGGGLAGYLNVDPVVVRVILAALTVVGGVGLVLYVAAWLLAPEEGADKSVLESHLPGNPRIRVLGWIVAGVLAVGAVVGSGPWFDWGWIGPIPLLGLVILIWVLARPRNTSTDTAETTATTPTSPTAPAATPATAAPAATAAAEPTAPATPETPDPSTTGTPDPPTPDTGAPDTDDDADASHDGDDSRASDDVHPADHRPTAVTAPLPPTPAPGPASSPPRDNGVLTWLTLGALVAVIGVLWLVDLSGTDVSGPVYLASSLAVVAVGILVGTWWGNGRWLIPAGALLTATLIGISQLPVWKFGEIKEAPTRSDDVLSSYEMGAGRIELDLTHVQDLAALDGRTITMDNGLGEIQVLLPDDLDVTVTAELNAGNVDVLGRDASGAEASTQYTDLDDTDPDLRLEIDGSLGSVEVIRP
jgi:phage shock protein PspC (stress-responsive transcriptional regulator)